MTLAERSLAILACATAALPNGGEVRDGQVDMAKAVANAITAEEHLVVAAGTGTGKSLAYLAPLVASGQRCLIATATKALQDQLAEKELPHIEQTSDADFTWAILKGRNNYACRQRVNEAANQPQLALETATGGSTSKKKSTSLAEEIDRLVVWADTTTSGDRAELDFEPSPAAWSAVSVTSRECPGRSTCPSGNNCLAEAARENAAAADIVVVNTHLLGVDIITEHAVLPDFDVLVIDEAHQLEDVITSTCGWSLTGGRFNAFARTVNAILEDKATIDDLEDAGALLSDALNPLTGQLINIAQEPDLIDAIVLGRGRVDQAMAKLRKVPKGKDADADARRDRAVQGANALLSDLIAAETSGGAYTSDLVVWVEENFNFATLRIAPLDVGEVLRPGLWDGVTAILTSATLSPTLPQTLGLPEDNHQRLDVESPFDYPKQGLLYCASQLPEPRSPQYEEQVLPHLEELMIAAGGRTLSLFTSWRMMDTAAEYLIPRMPWPVLTQRDLPKNALVEEFIEDPESILLATMGFWQGIDIPGQALSLVTIDRLPFPRPDDPLLTARREHAGRTAFRDVDLARATTLLAQGAGRLIRTSSDEGVVAVLDGRMATKKSYRWDFVNALPPFSRTGDPQVAIQRLQEIRDRA